MSNYSHHGPLSEELTPEARAALREEALSWAAFQERMAFLRFQARLPFRALLLGTTAILTGKVRT